jgi:RimJ/RimL family protein N-acetyltransferase
MKIVETDRLVVRQVTTEDAGFILELLNEPAYHQNIGDRGVRTLEDSAKYISDKFIASYTKFGFGLFLVELKNNQVPIGICGLIKRDSLPDVDIGFAILSKFQKQGYAFESASAVLGYAKNTIKLKRIVGLTLPHNTASIKLLEKIGLKFERMFLLTENGHHDKLFSLDF